MSFRSVCALPTCLHTRLAFSRPSRLWTSATCVRCYAQAVASVRDNSHGRLVRPVAPHVRQYPKDRIASRAQEDVSRHATALAEPSRAPPRVNSTSTTAPAARVGTGLEVPNFIYKDSSQVDPPTKLDVVRRHNQAPKQETQDTSTGGGYKEWEELHDRFLQVRRTCPGQTEAIFRDHIDLIKSFIGSSTASQAVSVRFKDKWQALTINEQKMLLPRLLVGSLADSAATSLTVLNSVGSIPFSFLIRMNCLRCIGIMHWKELQQKPELKRLYGEQITRLQSPDTWPRNKLPTVLLQNLLFWSTPEQCSIIIKNFFARYPDAEPSSLVAIIDHYLRVEDQDSAMERFRQLPTDMLRRPNQIIQGLRDRLLHLDVVAKGESGTNFKYLPQLLALGVPPDEKLHNAVIESAILNGLPDVAWDLYQYLESSQFASNARSHLVLLRDAFGRGDLERVNKVMTAIHNREDLISDQYLMAYSMNIVRIISCYDKKLGPDEARSHIMALYDRAYNRAPLERLRMVQPLKHSDEQRSTVLAEPSPTLLAFTVWTHTLIQRHDGNVLRLWQWITHLVSTGDQAVTNAMRYDVIYHGLMLYHARRANTLFRALEVMQYMLSGKLCLPTPRTWSILLCAYLRHNQVEQAEQVMALMLSKGFKIEEVNEKYVSYVPVGHDLQALADRISQNLDEKDMPRSMEDLLSESASLQSSHVAIKAGFD